MNLGDLEGMGWFSPPATSRSAALLGEAESGRSPINSVNLKKISKNRLVSKKIENIFITFKGGKGSDPKE